MTQQQTRPTASSSSHRDAIAVRMPVFSNDGFHLGHIQELDPENRQIKVSAPGKYDYWLEESAILSVRAGYVLLSLSRGDAEHRSRISRDRSRPFLSPDSDHARHGEGNSSTS